MNKHSAMHLLSYQNQFFILDIDSTLVSTHLRNQAIISEFVLKYSKKFPEDCEQLKSALCQQGDYGYVASLHRIGFTTQDPETMTTLRRFWEINFFSNHYLHHDLPLPGAAEWVQQLKNKDIQFVYLTARHKKSMWEGTLESMSKMGFPIDENCLYLKENLNESDEFYKTQTMARIRPRIKNQEIWFLDNEPVVLHSIRINHPDVKLAWFDSCHSGKMQPPPEAAVIRSFF